jgi:hypothetical protein
MLWRLTLRRNHGAISREDVQPLAVRRLHSTKYHQQPSDVIIFRIDVGLWRVERFELPIRLA